MKRRSVARFCNVLLCLSIASFPFFACSCEQDEPAGPPIDCHVYIICAYKANLGSGHSAEMDSFIDNVFWTTNADLGPNRIFHHGSKIKASKLDAYPIYWDELFLEGGVTDASHHYYPDDTWPKTYEVFVRWTKSKCEHMYNWTCPALFILKADYYRRSEQVHAFRHPWGPGRLGDAAGCVDPQQENWSFTSGNPYGVLYDSTAARYISDVNGTINANWPSPYNTARIQYADLVSYVASHELSHEVGIYPIDETSPTDTDTFAHDADTLCVMNQNGYGAAALTKAQEGNYAWGAHIINMYPNVKHICTFCAKSRMNRTIDQFYLSKCPNARQGI